jgi:hypothetical protein
MTSGKDVLRLDAQPDQEFPQRGGKSVHGLAMEICIPRPTLRLSGTRALLGRPPMFDRLVEKCGLVGGIHGVDDGSASIW